MIDLVHNNIEWQDKTSKSAKRQLFTNKEKEVANDNMASQTDSENLESVNPVSEGTEVNSSKKGKGRKSLTSKDISETEVSVAKARKKGGGERKKRKDTNAEEKIPLSKTIGRNVNQEGNKQITVTIHHNDEDMSLQVDDETADREFPVEMDGVENMSTDDEIEEEEIEEREVREGEEELNMKKSHMSGSGSGSNNNAKISDLDGDNEVQINYQKIDEEEKKSMMRFARFLEENGFIRQVSNV